MSKIAFLFPGQGSQSVGMGHDFYQASPQARHIYDTFNRIVSPDLSKICFEGPESELKRTIFTQPAILATSLAAFSLFRAQCDLEAVITAGHSLGEYGALFASGVIDLETAAQLVQKRAELMENAPSGAMSAVLGLAETQVEKAVIRVKHENKGPITVANYNTGDQYVISGAPEAVAAATEVLKEEGAKRVLPLPVGGAFHSPLMDQAAEDFASFLAGFTFHNAKPGVITNLDAVPTTQAEDFRTKLAEQINHSVRWSHSMQLMVAELGVDTLIEFGPGKVLTGMARKMYPDVRVFNVSDQASLEATLQGVRSLARV
jgi:[acyl-carrier-protein] S-malonyltransferase